MDAKYSVWVLWFGSLAAMFFGHGWVATAGQGAFALTALAHAVEFLANRSLFQKAGGSMVHHFVQTMIYGLFHFMPIKRRLDSAS